MLSPLLLRSPRPPLAVGVLAAIGGAVAATLAVYPLAHVAPIDSLGVVYLPIVVLVATYWGSALGLLTALGSALAYNYFHLPVVGQITLSNASDWVSLVTFLVVAGVAGVVGDLARNRAAEAEERRREADLATEMARLMLGGSRLDVVLGAAAQRLTSVLGLSSAAIELGEVPADRRLAFPLRDSGSVIATLLVPATLTAAERERVSERIVPALQSVLAAALQRAELEAEVVETALLRRNDEMKTAVLRSVSHDLRTPITAIITAATTLPTDTPEGAEAVDVVRVAAMRLSRLIEKLLDLSLLQAGTAEHRRVPYAIDDVLHEAIAYVQADSPAQEFRISLDDELPLVSGDPAQLERAFANLLENAARYSAGKPVSIRAHRAGERLRVRIVDQGPGIRPSELDRIFLPFYRSATDGPEHQGSGLGLAIARGFVEHDGGKISAESLPGQGTSFVVELPVAEPAVTRPQPAVPAVG
ncbi:MAG: ATP-binding protein [Solirubrobacteraceae bacterium]